MGCPDNFQRSWLATSNHSTHLYTQLRAICDADWCYAIFTKLGGVSWPLWLIFEVCRSQFKFRSSWLKQSSIEYVAWVSTQASHTSVYSWWSRANAFTACSKYEECEPCPCVFILHSHYVFLETPQHIVLYALCHTQSSQAPTTRVGAV